MIHDEHSEQVFGLINDLLDDLAPEAEYREVFDRAIGKVRDAAGSSAIFPPVDLPMAVADAMGLPVYLGIVAAAASTLLWSGADLMDDTADGQLSDEWNLVSPPELALVATNLLSTLPHLLVGRYLPRGSAAGAAYSQAVAKTLFVMSQGQSLDLRATTAVKSVADYIGLVRRKSGSEFALFASTPAMLAGSPPETVAQWVGFGMNWGSMVQVFSDTISSLSDGPRNDLFSGKRALPVLYASATLSDTEHSAFFADLDKAASGDKDALERAVQTMTCSGAASSSFEKVELLRFRSAQALPIKATDLTANHPLRRLLESCTVI